MEAEGVLSGAWTAPRTENPRGTSRLLVDKVFGSYFFGKLLSTAGVWVFNIVAAVVVWDLSHSTVSVGLVSVALFIPQVLFAPASGAKADRSGPKVPLVIGRLIVAAGAGALAVTIAVFGRESLPLEALLVIIVSAVVGIGFVVGGPAQMSILPNLVRPSELSAAVALNSLPPTLARAAGPAFGTFLLASLGPAAAFAFTAICNLAYAIILMLLPVEGRVLRAGAHEGSVRAGLRYVSENDAVLLLLLAALAAGLGSDPVITLTPALSEEFGRGSTLVGPFATAFGIGAVVGYGALARLIRRVGPPRLTSFGLILLSVGLALCGVASPVQVPVTGLVLGGVGFCWALTGTTTLIYEIVPKQFRGRVMALWLIAFAGSRPVGAAISGVLSDASGVGLAFLANGAFVFAVFLVMARGRAGSSPTLSAPPELSGEGVEP